jgi:hypothetical protein
MSGPEDTSGRATYLEIMTGQGLCADAGHAPLAGDAGFAEVFGCTRDSDCTMTCRGAVTASFGKRALQCFDGCLQSGDRAVCQGGICVAPTDALHPDGRACSPGLYADAGIVCPSQLEAPPPLRCRQEAKRIAPVRSFPGHSVAMDGRFVYWTEMNRLRRAPVAGGEPELLLNSRFVYLGVAAEGELYFTTKIGVGGTLDVAALAPDGTLRILATDAGAPDRLIAHGDYLYWQHRPGFARVQRHGGPVETVEPVASALALAGDVVWWIAREDPVMQSKPDGLVKRRVGRGQPATLGPAPLVDWWLVACGGAVYWVDGPWTDPKSGRLLRNRVGSPAVDVVASVHSVEAMTCSEGMLLWSETRYGGGTPRVVIRTLADDGGPPIDVACADGLANGLAAGAGYAYWISYKPLSESFIVRAPIH